MITICFSGCKKIKNTKSDTEVRALCSYGTVNYFPSQDNYLSIGVVSTGNKDLSSNPISLKFDNDCVDVKNITITKSIHTSNYTLWYVNFSYDIIGIKQGEVILKSMVLNGVYKTDIGNLGIQVTDGDTKDSESIVLSSRSAASFGVGLKSFVSELENDSTDKIILNKISILKYQNTIVSVTNNTSNKTYPLDVIENNDDNINLNAIETNPKDNFILDIDLSQCSQDEIQVYYVSPILYYSIGEKKYILRMEYYTSGLNINKNELNDIASNMEWRTKK